ncbi:MAG TPA: universal stress protein [Azospira sp.]|nr:universal stress protein [Rhodocyclaceae bacterium]HNJ77556.1 universal stress protein [Azospira sp.]HNN46258.1 universal stress protein [Azospira sp.]
MYKRIMVAIDDSATSNKALNEAAQLATSVGAALCIVHAEDESLLEHSAISTGTLIDVGEVEAEIRAGGMQLLNGAAEHVARHGITAEKRLIESSSKRVPEMITECARDWEADLVIVGTHGRRGMERLLVGSVAEKLVRVANTSLMLVRE